MKITENQFILILNGPSCGGKSSIADILMSKYEGLFNSKGDKIKWLISQYESKIHI